MRLVLAGKVSFFKWEKEFSLSIGFKKRHLKPFIQFPPYEIVMEEIDYDSLSLSDKELVDSIRSYGINQETASRLSQLTGSSKKFWLNLQSNYNNR